MFKIKSFQRRILVALLAIGLIPAALLLLGGTYLLRTGIHLTGTAGPWSSVAESGQILLARMDSAGVADSAVVEAARTHREALSESLRNSRLFALMGDRFLDLLPFLALGLILLVGILAYLVARQLSRGFSRPIQDLVGWTALIGKGESLPPPGPADTRGVKEFTQLRKALRDMADELEEGRRQAVQSAKLRSWTEMARRVAHELKNPLTPMRLAAATLRRLEGPGVREAGTVLMEEIERLDEMARTFSQFGRMPEAPPAEVDMVELLRALVDQHRSAGVEIRLSAPPDLPLVMGHYDALQRSFRNLLLNALQAAGERGEVEVELSAGDDCLLVAVRDTGPGIPEENLERIWDPDFTTRSRGTGLGLAMVRQTIDLHQGRVTARNRSGGGAVFLVELPMERS